jgi:methionyl-tRNA formyltransferase
MNNLVSSKTHPSLKIIFMGTPDFSIKPLKALLGSTHNITAIYSQPPRKSGRGMKENKTPVHVFGEDEKIPVYTPQNFKNDNDISFIKDLNPDIIIVSAYGLILPKEILDIPKFGCLNIHASILPRWRGAAPIERSIMSGDKQTGITFMLMDEGLDTGMIIKKFPIKIDQDMNAKSLHDKLSLLASDNLIDTLCKYVNGEIQPFNQEEEGITYAEKIQKIECRISWEKSADEILHLIRGLSPYPGAWFLNKKNKRVKVLDARILNIENNFQPGEVINEQAIACGHGAIEILSVKPEGKKTMYVEDYLRGNSMSVGEILN